MKKIIIVALVLALTACSRTTYRGAAIRDRLTETSGIAAHNISIEEEPAGIVTLNGNVSSNKDRDMIEEIARETNGVDSVRSNLVVDSSTIEVRAGSPYTTNSDRPIFSETTSERNDLQLSHNVREYLGNMSEFDLRNVEITTRDRVVTLRGKQSSTRSIDNLISATKSVSGVRAVRNELYVNNY